MNDGSATSAERGLFGNLAVATELATSYGKLAENAKIVGATDARARAIFRFARRRADAEAESTERFNASVDSPRFGLTQTERTDVAKRVATVRMLRERVDQLEFDARPTSSQNVREISQLAVVVPTCETPQPVPTPSTRVLADRDVTIDGPAAVPAYPEISREQGAVGTAVVRVTVWVDGKIRAASIATSTGNAALD